MFARSSGFGAGQSAGRAASETPPPLPARPRVPVGAYGVEVLRAADLDAIVEPWRRLVRAAVCPSPFVEPAVLASAARHLPEGRRLEVLCVWREEALVGLFPLVRSGLAGARLVPFRAPLVPRATPLIDAREAAEIVAAAQGFARLNGQSLTLGDVPLAGPVAEIARAAGLTPRAEPAAALRGFRGPPGEAGRRLVVKRIGAAAEMREAVERVLTLDAEIAREARGTALVADVGMASLVRAATRRAARERACRVHLASRDGVLLAAAIVLRDALWISCARPGPEGAAALATLVAPLPASESVADFAAGAPAPRGRLAERLSTAGDWMRAARRLVGAREAS